jgi:hypothetical protein
MSWKDLMVQQERYRDLQREIEHDRRARQALAECPRRARAYAGLLAWLGQQLVRWGSALQEAYGNASPAASLSSVDHTLPGV